MNSPLSIPAANSPFPRLRLWPGVALVALQWTIRFGVPLVVADALPFAVLGGVACGLAVLVWWMFFSRAPWTERFIALAIMVVALLVTRLLVHPSIASGMMGLMLVVYATPVLSLALVAWAAFSRNLATGPRRAWLAATMVVAAGGFTLVRTGGMTSEADSDFHWRWSPTPEDRLLAQSTATDKPAVVAPAVRAPENSGAGWTGFRGPSRDSILRGTKIETNWSASPPVELWRHPIGPGWASFAVEGDLVYTQEQRGEHEVVSCYRLATGKPVWRHQDAVRFWESNAGAGPRSTPTLYQGRAYTFGATGVVNALDALTGAVIWRRNAATDTKKIAPEWGFASSPLVVGDLVFVAATGTLVAYDRATGATRWTGPTDGKSYSSPHLLEIDGVPQVVLMSGTGATSFAPANGKVLWQHGWEGFAIVQPAQIANGELLISTGDRVGARRIDVKRANDTWTVTERWTSNRLKPYFNDFVLHRGHAFGFDNGILACVDLADGKAKWKGGRYGRGQVVLLADQDVLLVLTEQGEIALVAATPGEFTELGKRPALEGKTWNHPVLAGDVLLVRNDQEMAAFRLAVQPPR